MIQFLLAILALPVFANISPMPIPRHPSKVFVKEGLFKGGAQESANIENLRFSKHPETKSERWVFDFSDRQTRTVGKLAPQFQISYNDGDSLVTPPKFIINFRAISQNYLDKNRLALLSKKSNLVKEIILYPPIENGDQALEIVLKAPVKFEPHQPLQKEGRLVLDLKSR